MSGEQPKFELSVPQIAGGALAAVTAAVAASYLGVAGTVIGAAVASVASTVGNAIYTHYLKRTGDQLKQHTVIAWRDQPGEAEPPAKVADEGELATAVASTVRAEPPAEGEATLVMAPVEPVRRFRPSWPAMGGTAGVIFVISMGGILAYQGIAGETLPETWHGKAQQPAVVEHQKAPEDDEKPAGEQSTSADPTPTPTAKPTPSKTPTTAPPTTRPDSTPTPSSPDTVEPSGDATPPPSPPPSVPPTGLDPDVGEQDQGQERPEGADPADRAEGEQ